MQQTYNAKKGKQMPKTYKAGKSKFPEHYTYGKASKRK